MIGPKIIFLCVYMTMIFHLAIPIHDIPLAKDFYTSVFQATVGREYPGYVIFNFFGHQVVGHMTKGCETQEVSMYPRHFGVIPETYDDFETLYQRAKEKSAPFFEERFERFKDKPGWHETFFVMDPSKNLIEVKYYHDKEYIFSKG